MNCSALQWQRCEAKFALGSGEEETTDPYQDENDTGPDLKASGPCTIFNTLFLRQINLI